MDASRIGVVFDCDGTLLDTMDVWRDMETELARRAGVELSKADTDELTTLTIPECGEFFHSRLGLGSSVEDVLSMIDDFILDFYQKQVTGRPGALAFVRGLVERGVAVSVASSSPQTYLQAGLVQAGFSPYLQAIVSVDDVGTSKREPAVYDRAREIMGTSLQSTWGVEDSLYALHTLRGAGYRTLAIYDRDDAGTFEDLSANADVAILSFEDIDVDEFIAWSTGSEGVEA